LELLFGLLDFLLLLLWHLALEVVFDEELLLVKEVLLADH
jgi:hypothetical protein